MEDPMLTNQEIVFCDNHILIALKLRGLPTQPPPEGGESLEGYAKAWLKQEYKKPGNVFLHAIHRLDKPVSGLVLFARTSKALSRLNEMQRNMEIQRVYVAEVEGILPAKEGKLDHYLIHGDHKAIIGTQKDKEAKHARLTYQVNQFKERTTVVTIELETGRYHQIRAQFSATGHPIVNDTKYGAKSGNEQGIHLHCMMLAFKHPVTKELVQLQTPIPF